MATMVEEMKKKNRLLQHYILQEETGALSSATMDEHKVHKASFTLVLGHSQRDQKKSPNVYKSCPKMISVKNDRF